MRWIAIVVKTKKKRKEKEKAVKAVSESETRSNRFVVLRHYTSKIFKLYYNALYSHEKMTNCTFKNLCAHGDATRVCYFDVRLVGVCKPSRLNLLRSDGVSFLGQVGAGGKRPGAPQVHGLRPITTWPSLKVWASVPSQALLPSKISRRFWSPTGWLPRMGIWDLLCFGRRAQERVLGRWSMTESVQVHF